MTKSEFGRAALAVSVTALLCAGFLWIIAPFIPTLIWSAIVVTTMWPTYRTLTKKLGGRTGLAAGLMVTLLALTFLLVVVPLFANISNEATDAAGRLGAFSVSDQDLVPLIDRLPLFASERLHAYLRHSADHKEQARQFFVSYSGYMLQIFGTLAKGVAQGALQFVLVLLTSFFFFRSGAMLGRDVKRACFKIGGERFLTLLDAVQGTVKGAVLGLLLTALAQGILAGVAFVATGAPVPVLLGFTTVVFSFIPFGAPLIYVPVAAIVTFTDGWGWGLALLAWGIGIVSNADNVIRPIFISQATSLPILLVFFATIGGLLSYGMLGLFIGPALAAVAVTLWREFVR